MMKALWLFLLFFSFHLIYPASSHSSKDIQQKAENLKAYLEKEKSKFESRENQRTSLLGSLDEVNQKQNAVRQKLQSLAEHQQELEMSLENLELEVKNQQDIEAKQRKKLFSLLQIVYQIQKQGLVPFVFSTDGLSSISNKIRIIIFTLRSHARLTEQYKQRIVHLEESKLRLKAAKEQLSQLSEDLSNQKTMLDHLLENKKRLVSEINKKQSFYRKASKEYRQISHQLSKLFKELSSKKKQKQAKSGIPQGDLPLPTPGEIVQSFGKSIHEKFKTVTYHKGILIESEFNSPVISILPGTVEYAGWLRGLGNVMIIHHGEGLHTLSAHLFKLNKLVGDKVNQSEVIGFVGDTGNSEKPSLYFEIRNNGEAVDPLKYITTEKVS